MLYGCPFEKIHFLTRIDTHSGFGRDWDTLWGKNHNGTFIALNFAGTHSQPPFSINGKNIVTRDLGDSELVVGFSEQLIFNNSVKVSGRVKVHNMHLDM